MRLSGRVTSWRVSRGGRLALSTAGVAFAEQLLPGPLGGGAGPRPRWGRAEGAACPVSLARGSRHSPSRSSVRRRACGEGLRQRARHGWLCVCTHVNGSARVRSRVRGRACGSRGDGCAGLLSWDQRLGTPSGRAGCWRSAQSPRSAAPGRALGPAAGGCGGGKPRGAGTRLTPKGISLVTYFLNQASLPECPHFPAGHSNKEPTNGQSHGGGHSPPDQSPPKVHLWTLLPWGPRLQLRSLWGTFQVKPRCDEYECTPVDGGVGTGVCTVR